MGVTDLRVTALKARVHLHPTAASAGAHDSASLTTVWMSNRAKAGFPLRRLPTPNRKMNPRSEHANHTHQSELEINTL